MSTIFVLASRTTINGSGYISRSSWTVRVSDSMCKKRHVETRVSSFTRGIDALSTAKWSVPITYLPVAAYNMGSVRRPTPVKRSSSTTHSHVAMTEVLWYNSKLSTPPSDSTVNIDMAASQVGYTVLGNTVGVYMSYTHLLSRCNLTVMAASMRCNRPCTAKICTHNLPRLHTADFCNVELPGT